MKDTASVTHSPQELPPTLALEIAQLREENVRLKQRVAWFERQVFGQKSEKRPVENPHQNSLLGNAVETKPVPEDKVRVSYLRGKAKKQRPGGCATDAGLRFNDDVPVEIINVTPPELRGDKVDQYEVIDTKVSHKLAQRPASHVVLQYEIPVLKRIGTSANDTSTAALVTTAMPDQVLDGSIADVSVLVGLLVDKFCYHLPLHRQHQRMAQAGVTLARSTLTNWVKRSVELLRPVVEAQLQQVLQSKLIEAEDSDPEASAEALGRIGRLYQIETHIRTQSLQGEEKRQCRLKYSKSVVNEFFAWCKEQCHRVELTPTHPLSKALKYALNREQALRVFLQDPDLPMDTNHLEREIRPVPLGRRNWLFCWTELGAEHVGIIQSLISTCKLQGVNPHTYLTDVLQRVAMHPASRVVELTPRLWREQYAKNPMKSVLDRDRVLEQDATPQRQSYAH